MSTPPMPPAPPVPPNNSFGPGQPLPMVTFADAVKTCFSKYVDFTGRARRSEYWLFALFNFVVNIFVQIVDAAVGASNILVLIVGLGLFLPGLAVGIRRLHDTDRSGWFSLLALIPIVGTIVLLVFLCQDSKPGENRFGRSPKYV